MSFAKDILEILLTFDKS